MNARPLQTQKNERPWMEAQTGPQPLRKSSTGVVTCFLGLLGPRENSPPSLTLQGWESRTYTSYA
jgi:hypothetical protein